MELKADIQELKGKAASEKTSLRERKGIVCYNCNKKGHIVRFCQAPKRKESEN